MEVGTHVLDGNPIWQNSFLFRKFIRRERDLELNLEYEPRFNLWALQERS
jgi:hypothetical protein